MLLFVDGCRARLDSAQLTTAHREGHRRNGGHIRVSDHSNSDIRDTCNARCNKPSGRDGVVKISSGGRRYGGGGRRDGCGGHDNRKRQTGEACFCVCDFKSPVCST